MATMYAGPGDVYVPTFDEQAKLIVEYTRNPKDYVVNQLVTVTPVSKPQGKYLRIKPEIQGNITANWNASRRWADGDPRPIQTEAGQKHEWLTYFTERYVESFALGDMTTQLAVWDIVKAQSGVLANRMMTGLAVDIYTALTTAGNYTNTASATVAGGGKWDAGSITNRYIQNSLNYAVEAIRKSTMNGVKPEDLILVLPPNIAKQIGATAEVAEFVAQQQFAPDFIRGELWKNYLGNYGCPPVLYGIKVIVDDLVVDTAALGATSAKSFAAGTTSAYLISRQGALSSEAGGSNFSFLHVFRYKDEEMKVEVVDDPFNKRKVLSVLDNREVRPVSNEAAFLFTACVD